MTTIGSRHYWAALPALVAPFSAAVAADYLTEEGAQKTLFPEATTCELQPSPDGDSLRAAVAKIGGALWESPPKIWAAQREVAGMGKVVIDRVIGKHDFITYAVGITTGGVIRGVGILSYREVYGGEVRHERWRGQFIGKRKGDPLRVPLDIKNITGATLSCRPVTDGVRRILALMEALGG